MATIDKINIAGETIGQVEVSDKLAEFKCSENLVHACVVSYLAAQRGGNASTLTKGGVKATGAKPWNQKGTGRARAGTNNSPIWRGGGVTFGPKPRDYSFKLNRKVRKQALAMAISARLQEGNLVVVDEFVMDAIKTKDFVNIMKGFDFENCLLITEGTNENLNKSARNANGFKVMNTDGLNVYDILLHKKLMLVKPAVESIEKRLEA